MVVEDCTSACSVSRISSSVGLLGTSLNEAVIPYLMPYKTLYIALDDDATNKAVTMQHTLSLYRPTKIIPLKKDLKYFSLYELNPLMI